MDCKYGNYCRRLQAALPIDMVHTKLGQLRELDSWQEKFQCSDKVIFLTCTDQTLSMDLEHHGRDHNRLFVTFRFEKCYLET